MRPVVWLRPEPVALFPGAELRPPPTPTSLPHDLCDLFVGKLE